MIRCPRCQSPLDIGHRCAGDECPRCGTARLVIVETVDARGSLSVQQPCERCKVQPSAASGLTAQESARKRNV